MVSVNTFLCHGKKYLVLFTKTVIMISRKDYRNQNDFHPGIYLRILVSPQNGLLHTGSLLTPGNFKPDLTGKDKITPVKSQSEPVV